jgi:hypothetical protein
VTPRAAARVAWGIGTLCAVGAVAAFLLATLNGAADIQAAAVTVLLAFPLVGALVAARQPGNAVGWLLIAVGVFLTVNLVGESYARYALVTAPGSLPGGLYGAWLGWTYAPIVATLAIFLPLYFPTGRLLSPRWRPVVWLGIGFVVFAIAGNALWPGPDVMVRGLGPVRNPVIFLPRAKPLVELFRNLAGLCLLPGIAGALAALVVRFRRSRGIERQQLKWFTYAAALAPLPGFVYENAPDISELLLAVIYPLVPVAIGIAMLRYRLYEIDRIINRTLVYGTLTVILGLIYAGAVLVLGQLFGGVGTDPPSWAVAGATLAVAALFQPARRRIQQAVDRRFNRRKYNTTQTIEAFSTRLRDQVDLDTLSTELLAVVDQTMEPTRVSLWLRASSQGSPGTAGSVPQPTPWAY